METDCLLSCSQLARGPYPEPIKPRPQPRTLFLQEQFHNLKNIYRSAKWSLHYTFSTKFLHEFLIIPMRATYPSNLNL